MTTTDISLALLLGPQLQAFAGAGYDVVAVSAPGPFVSDLSARGIRHIPLPHATRSFSVSDYARAAAALYGLFRRLRPEIVHTHNPKPGVYGRVAARTAGVPAVVNTVHGLYATPDDPLVRRATVYGLERAAVACSDAELVQNPEDLETLAALRIPRDRLHLLGNGIDLDRFRPHPGATEAGRQLRAQLGAADSSIVVGVVGRLVWEKGYRELFAAASALRRRVPQVVVVVAGPSDPEKRDGIGPDHLAAAVAAGVHFLGLRRDVETVYAGVRR